MADIKKPLPFHSFRALTHINFTIFWFGQIISLIGSWMQTITLPWLSYTLTKSAFLLGLVGAMQFTPMLFFSLFAGVLIDKFDKKKIIIISQTILMICALILSILVFTNQIKYWQIIVIALCIGCANTFDMPCRQSFIMELVGREDLMNAIALNSAIFNVARIIGPTIAGLAMQFLGMSFCFLANALSFIPVIIGLFFIKPEYKKNHVSKNHILKDVAEGIKYIFSQKILFWTLLAVFIIGTFGMNFNVLVPVYAKTVLDMKEAGFGFLMACMGFGSLCGAMTVAARSKKGPKTIMLAIASLVTTLAFIAIGFSKNFYISASFLALAGFSNVTFFTTANSTLQLNSLDEYRGRVISVYTLLFGGTTPFGNLFTGSISNKYGAGIGFLSSAAAILILITILFFFNRHYRINNLKKSL